MLTWLHGVCNVIVNFLFRSYFCLVAVGRYNRSTQEFARGVDRLWTRDSVAERTVGAGLGHGRGGASYSQGRSQGRRGPGPGRTGLIVAP